MLNLTEITAIVREYLDDASATVTQPILDSINFLSNYFYIDSFDESQSTAIDENTLNIPTNSLVVDKVYIDGDEVLKLNNLDDIQNIQDTNQQRWYEFDKKIQFTQYFSSIKIVKIYYKKGFTEPTTVIDTDVPTYLLELVYIGAQYRYYNKLLTQLVLSKPDLPDINPDELRKIRNDVKSHYLELIKIIKLNNQNA